MESCHSVIAQSHHDQFVRVTASSLIATLTVTVIVTVVVTGHLSNHWWCYSFLLMSEELLRLS